MVSRGAQKIVYVAVTISKPTSLGTLEVREVCPVGRVTYRVRYVNFLASTSISHSHQLSKENVNSCDLSQKAASQVCRRARYSEKFQLFEVLSCTLWSFALVAKITI